LWLFFGKKKKKESPIIYTVETCQDCGEMNRRIFGPNDYIYKTTTTCKKCTGIVMITAVYGEYPPEKQKQKNIIAV
jgi:hypothetical protein